MYICMYVYMYMSQPNYKTSQSRQRGVRATNSCPFNVRLTHRFRSHSHIPRSMISHTYTYTHLEEEPSWACLFDGQKRKTAQFGSKGYLMNYFNTCKFVNNSSWNYWSINLVDQLGLDNRNQQTCIYLTNTSNLNNNCSWKEWY